MKHFAAIFLTSILSILPCHTLAYLPQEGNITSAYGPLLNQTILSRPPTGVQSSQMGGMQLLVFGDINNRSSLEVGLGFMHRIFFRALRDNYLQQSIQTAHITMGYRRWYNNWLSGGISFYSAYPMNDPFTVQESFKSISSMDTSATDLTEYGFDFSLQFQLYSWEKTNLALETKYSRSLTAKPNEFGDQLILSLLIRGLTREKRQPERKSRPIKAGSAR